MEVNLKEPVLNEIDGRLTLENIDGTIYMDTVYMARQIFSSDKNPDM